MTPDIQSLQTQIDKLKADIKRSAQVVSSTIALTGASSSCCAKLGINITTGILYYVDVNKNWQPIL